MSGTKVQIAKDDKSLTDIFRSKCPDSCVLLSGTGCPDGAQLSSCRHLGDSEITRGKCPEVEKRPCLHPEHRYVVHMHIRFFREGRIRIPTFGDPPGGRRGNGSHRQKRTPVTSPNRHIAKKIGVVTSPKNNFSHTCHIAKKIGSCHIAK